MTQESWSRFNAFLMLAATAACYAIHETWPLAIVGALSFVAYWVYLRHEWQPLGILGGPANWVTSLRLLALLVLSAAGPAIGNWGVVALAVGVLASDGLDGYLARRTGTASLFGEYLDKETDAFYALTMALALYQRDLAGSWILFAGLLRYLYVPVVFFLKPPEKKEQRFKWGQIIAVVFMIGLILPFGLPQEIAKPALLFSVALVTFSFGRSFWIMSRGEKSLK